MPAKNSLPTVALVALPLGNVQDLSARARSTLESSDLIFCEDTRRLQDLAARAHLALKAKLVSLPGDRERDMDWARFLPDYATWALVSDAGTPIVNDPGASLLTWAQGRGCHVSAIPGPSAPVLAWQWSGGFGLPYVFAGFAPKAKRPEAKELAEFFAPLSQARTFVYFDSRHQAVLTLQGLVALGRGESSMFIAREMTKPHEELLKGNVSSMLEWLQARVQQDEGIGELTLVMRGDGSAPASTVSVDELARLRSAPTKEASKIMASLTGLTARECYDRLVKAQASGEDNE